MLKLKTKSNMITKNSINIAGVFCSNYKNVKSSTMTILYNKVNNDNCTKLEKIKGLLN